MNGQRILENANPTIQQVSNNDTSRRHRSLMGWSSIQSLLLDEAASTTTLQEMNPVHRSILRALQDGSAATSGKSVSVLRSIGVSIPEKQQQQQQQQENMSTTPLPKSTVSSSSASTYIPLEFGASLLPCAISTTKSQRPATAATKTHDRNKLSIQQQQRDPIDADEIFDIIRNIQDPEHPLTLEQLSVVSRRQIVVDDDDSSYYRYSTIDIRFTPTIPHCSMATLIGLCLRVKLLRSLPGSDCCKVTIRIEPGTHVSEVSINKQLNDKERVIAALENKHLLGLVNKCLSGGGIH